MHTKYEIYLSILIITHNAIKNNFLTTLFIVVYLFDSQLFHGLNEGFKDNASRHKYGTY